MKKRKKCFIPPKKFLAPDTGLSLCPSVHVFRRACYFCANYPTVLFHNKRPSKFAKQSIWTTRSSLIAISNCIWVGRVSCYYSDFRLISCALGGGQLNFMQSHRRRRAKLPAFRQTRPGSNVCLPLTATYVVHTCRKKEDINLCHLVAIYYYHDLWQKPVSRISTYTSIKLLRRYQSFFLSYYIVGFAKRFSFFWLSTRQIMFFVEGKPDV